MSLVIEDLKKFLDSSATATHAASQMALRLALHDFSPLEETKRWQLEKGKKYFVLRDGAFLAFQMPEHSLQSMLILASHTDSPALKLKPCCSSQKENMTLLSSEVYGAPLLSSWLNRDLCIAGKVVVKAHDGTVKEHLVHLNDTLITIPQLAIHLDREVNEKGLLLNKQEHLKAIIGLGLSKDWSIEELLKRTLPFQTLLSSELFLVPAQPSQYIGVQNEMLSSYRIDNLVSAHACCVAMTSINRAPCYTMPLLISTHHEEIGSRSLQGAYGSLLKDVLRRIFYSLKLDEEDQAQALRRSLCLSLDMAHGYHPGFENRFEPDHRPLMGQGVVFKYNADNKYATSSKGAAFVKNICLDKGLIYQEFVARSDMGCGSTIGPILSHTFGIETVDMGIAQLSMHSSRELMALKDYSELCNVLTSVIQQELST